MTTRSAMLAATVFGLVAAAPAAAHAIDMRADPHGVGPRLRAGADFLFTSPLGLTSDIADPVMMARLTAAYFPFDVTPVAFGLVGSFQQSEFTPLRAPVITMRASMVGAMVRYELRRWPWFSRPFASLEAGAARLTMRGSSFSPPSEQNISWGGYVQPRGGIRVMFGHRMGVEVAAHYQYAWAGDVAAVGEHRTRAFHGLGVGFGLFLVF